MDSTTPVIQQTIQQTWQTCMTTYYPQYLHSFISRSHFDLENFVKGVWIRMERQLFASISWWRHQMTTFSALLAICAGNSPLNSPHNGQLCGALIIPLICGRINGWVNNREACDLRRHHAHYDVTVIKCYKCNYLPMQIDTLDMLPINSWWLSIIPKWNQCYTIAAIANPAAFTIDWFVMFFPWF